MSSKNKNTSAPTSIQAILENLPALPSTSKGAGKTVDTTSEMVAVLPYLRECSQSFILPALPSTSSQVLAIKAAFPTIPPQEVDRLYRIERWFKKSDVTSATREGVVTTLRFRAGYVHSAFTPQQAPSAIQPALPAPTQDAQDAPSGE